MSVTPLTTEQQRLVEDSMKLVKWCIGRASRQWVATIKPDEMLSIGSFAMTSAARSYDSERGTFANYAITAIRRAWYREFVAIKSRREFQGCDEIDVAEREAVIELYDPQIESMLQVIRTLPEKWRRVASGWMNGESLRVSAAKLGVSATRVGELRRKIKAHVLEMVTT